MDRAPYYHINAHWPRYGFVWPFAQNPVQGQYFIRPLYTNPRWRNVILLALENASGFPHDNLASMQAFVDKSIDLFVTTAVTNFIRLLYVDVLTFFAEIKDQVPWAQDLPPEVVMFLFVEMTRARAQWHSQPSLVDRFYEHAACARRLDLFQNLVTKPLEKLRYRVLRNHDEEGPPVIIEEGAIARFTEQGLVFNLAAGERIVSAQLADGIQHLTIGIESSGAQRDGRQVMKRARDAVDDDGDFLMDMEMDTQESASSSTQAEKRRRVR